MNRSAALLLTIATGFAALVYEVLWERYLAILLGSHAEARSAVLALFLGGLAAGYVIFGRYSRRIAAEEHAGRRLLFTYGLVEIGVGAFGIAFPLLFALVRRVSVAIPALGEFAGFLIDVVLAAVLIGPATVLMGATVPLLTQALTRSVHEATRTHALVYALNTVGAFVGAILAGYWLVPRFGLVWTIVAVGGIDVLAGLGYLALAKRPVRTAPLEDSDRGKTVGLGPFVLIAFLGGFAAMTVQTTVMRLAGLSFGSSPFTFSAVVATFVVSIAIGSLAVSACGPRIPRWSLPVVLWLGVLITGAMYYLAERGPYLAYKLRVAFAGDNDAFAAHQVGVFFALAAFTGPVAIVSGASLPLLFDLARRDDSNLGAVAGRLYGWNTLGSLSGALLGGHALLFFLDLHEVFRLAMVAVVLAASAACYRAIEGRARRVLIVAALPALIAIGAFPAWNPDALVLGALQERMPHPTFRTRLDLLTHVRNHYETLFHEDDPTATITVRRRISDGAMILFTNGKIDGNTNGDYRTMSLLGLLPALMVDEPRRALVIGWGTGISAAELAGVDSMEAVTVAEISRGVIHARELFDPFNEQASTHPKITMRRGDGYRVLMRSDGAWDVIVSEPSNPWMAGVEMLYSRDFLAAARDRLSNRGVFVQWFHNYAADDEMIELIVRTYASVFDDVAVWFTGVGDYALVGVRSADAVPGIQRLVDRWPPLASRFEKAGIETFPELLAYEVIPFGTFRDVRDEDTLHTLLRPRLNYLAVRGRFRGDQGHLPFTGWGQAADASPGISLLGQYLASDIGESTWTEVWKAAASTLCTFRQPECGAALGYEISRGTPADELLGMAENVWTRNGPLTETDLLVASLLFPPVGQQRLEIDVAGGERVLETYRSLYSHAVPFSPESLFFAIGDCVPEEGRTAEDCDRLLAQAHRLVEEGELRTSPRSGPAPVLTRGGDG